MDLIVSTIKLSEFPKALKKPQKIYAQPIAKQNKKRWQSHDKPRIICRYKMRKETDDCYLCMIEEKGVVILNEKSISILNLANGSNTIENIEKKLSRKINKKDIIEILDIFID
ncbi:hypothetical protein KAJ61_05350 [Candidatus Parcubacteria bacterium]|nr:hypothetical protein [Candidatus Parcubacteria bacterium]